MQEGPVLEVVELEVGAELAIHPSQQVAVELCGNALRVVVGSLHALGVLDEIDAQQQTAAVRPTQLCDSPEQGEPALAVEVADRRAGKERHALLLAACGLGQAEGRVEVRADRPDAELRKARRDAPRTASPRCGTNRNLSGPAPDNDLGIDRWVDNAVESGEYAIILMR